MKQILFIMLVLIFSAASYADFIQVSLLGTGSPRPDSKRAGPAVLVEAGGNKLIFDTGRGVIQRMEQLDVNVASIEDIFITHLHSDHISALDDIWLTGWIYQRPQPLKVYGPEGIKLFVDKMQKAYSYDVNLRKQYAGLNENSSKLIAYQISPGVVFEKDQVKVTAFLVNHKPVDPAYGYRIDFGDRSVVISGDTTISQNLIDHSQDVDLLIHEIFASQQKILEKNPRLQRIERYHTNPNQMIEILNKTKPKMTALTHVILIGIGENELLGKIKENYNGEVLVGEDLMRIEVGSEIRVVQHN